MNPQKLSVIEIKTGAPRAGHCVQLAAYVNGVRALSINKEYAALKISRDQDHNYHIDGKFGNCNVPSVTQVINHYSGQSFYGLDYLQRGSIIHEAISGGHKIMEHAMSHNDDFITGRLQAYQNFLKDFPEYKDATHELTFYNDESGSYCGTADMVAWTEKGGNAILYLKDGGEYDTKWVSDFSIGKNIYTFNCMLHLYIAGFRGEK